MSSRAIPAQSPIQDLFNGLLIQVGTTVFLSTSPVPDANVITQGVLIVRYGLRFQGKLQQSIVPGLVVLDYGDLLTGEQAWEFVLKHSNLHPRAEVVGHRNDGREDMVFLRALDFGVRPAVLVYRRESETVPLGEPLALLRTSTAEIPQRLLKYLDSYDTYTDWHLKNHE